MKYKNQFIIRITSFLFTFILFVISHSTFGQFQKHAQWEMKPSKTEVTIGEELELIFTAKVDADWYIYSSDIDPDLGPTPTSIEWEAHPSYSLVGGLKPVKPKKKFDEVWNGNITYFEGKGEFRQKVKVLAVDPVIKGSITFLTCSNKTGLCVPGEEDVTIAGLKVSAAIAQETIKEEPSKSEEVAITPIVTLEPLKVDSLQESVDSVSNTAAVVPSVTSTDVETLNMSDKEESLWGFALAAFLAGLAALLTPCVFPVIPMTVSYFTKQESGRSKALLYGAFIILIYTLIGVVVSRINGPAFANFLSTHWAPNLFFFGVFFLFALSFLGMFEIVLPSSFVNKIDSKADQGGLVGIFFMAFTLVLVSFSCTGPIAGSILVASAGGQVAKPIVGMVSYAAAFAIPFTLFAMFPNWMKSLPKSGGWLNTVKVVLGFLELALALKFLSIADQVYHWRLLDREVFLALWIVIFALLGFYLLGKLRTPHDSPVEIVSVPRILLAIVTFSFVVYMIPGMWGAPLKALAGYLPPQSTHDFDLSKHRTTGINTSSIDEKIRHADLFHLPHNLEGFFDLKQALAYGKKVNKPVFIDFTGHGCVNCREMEARVWSEPAVLKRLQNEFVIVALYVDDKTRLPEEEWYTSTFDGKVKKTIGAQNSDLQIVRYNNNAQPYYCIVDKDGKLLVEPTDYDLNPETFVSFLDKGLQAFKKK